MHNRFSIAPGAAKRLQALVISLLVLLSGILYYGVYRENPVIAATPGFNEFRLLANAFWPAGGNFDWFPTFAHAFATLLVFHSLIYGESEKLFKRYRLIVLTYLVFIEFAFGVLDPFDVGAIVLAAVCAGYTAYFLRLRPRTESFGQQIVGNSKYRRFKRKVSLLTLVGFSGLLASGSFYWGSPENPDNSSNCVRFENGVCVEFVQYATPIYMSYQELRESVRFETARTPENLGRIYLYQNYLLINEANEGIHVFDNSDPVVPINLGFINVPGNTDIAMRNGYLYADSYIDLVTIDLNDPANVSEVARQRSIFPYNAYQGLPNNVQFSSGTVNSLNGVVVSYRLTGS